MASSKRIRFVLIGIGVSMGFALVVLVKEHAERAVPTVPVVAAKQIELETSISTNGKIEPVDTHVFNAEFETTVSEVYVTEGQQVRAGQPILSLDSSEVQADLTQARLDNLAASEDLRDAQTGGAGDQQAQVAGDIRRAQVDVDRLQTKQKILQGLLADRAATEDEISQNAAALAQAQALLEQFHKQREELHHRAEVESETASLHVEQTQEKIHLLENKMSSAMPSAPFSGTVYSLPVRAGDHAMPGEVLAEMADLHQVRLRAFVDETDLGALKLHQPVRITWDAMPNKTWSGRTEQIPKEVVPRGTRSVGEVLCSVSNEDLILLPNVNVDVQVIIGQNHLALVVPRGTVREEQDRHFVFVVDGDRLMRREISVGAVTTAYYEVLGGLKEGDRVVLSSDTDLRDGMAVHVIDQP